MSFDFNWLHVSYNAIFDYLNSFNEVHFVFLRVKVIYEKQIFNEAETNMI
jgi:hypothetical protein